MYITPVSAIRQIRAKIKNASLKEVHMFSFNIFPEQLDSAILLLDKEDGRRSMRVTYNDDYNFIIKYMPGCVHQIAVSQWDTSLTLSLAQLTPGVPPPGWRGLGGIAFQLGQGKKEPDSAIGPRTTLLPSVVLEVGSSETLTQLRLDAHRWLEDMPAVEIVILLSIKPSIDAHSNVPNITIELWRAFALTQPQCAASAREARKVWSADWTLVATPLYILLSDIFKGQVPAAYGNNDRVQLDTVSLREAIVEAWVHQP